MYSRVPLQVRYVTLERCGIPRRISQRHEGSPSSLCLSHEGIGPFHMASFSSTPEMASSTTTSQAPRRRSPGLFTIFHEENTVAPTAKPTRRSPSKSNNLTVSHSYKSKWRAQHLCKNAKQEHQGCSNPPLSNPTKTTSAREELGRKNNGENQQMTPRSRSNGFPSLRGGIDW